MSNDMFRKMKERITDEVSSATNKLQNMQIIDQLASSIGQIRNDLEPNQLVPEPYDHSSAMKPINSQFSLIDDGPINRCNEDEELNSEISPQHQLFNECSIRRLNPTPNSFELSDNGLSASSYKDAPLKLQGQTKKNDNSEAVINIYELSSDIEDGLDSENKDEDVEIDLLSDEKTLDNHDDSSNDVKIKSTYLTSYRARYRDIVHDLRRIYQSLQNEKSKSQQQRVEFSNQIDALKMELESIKQQQSLSQHDSLISTSTTVSENEKSRAGSPQQPSKSSSKLKDLEKLLAKCKESLKLKNNQIKVLKESVAKVENFKNLGEELRGELKELREAHEFWTVSIAENKRVMHQEIENKNTDMERLRCEINDLQSRLNESHQTIKQTKVTVQDLESRLVRTSAAHQKERESLIKELNLAKNNAVRQVQKDSERTIERIKLDLEKSIEALKLELLNKDEQLIKSAEIQVQLNEQNNSLRLQLTDANNLLQEQLKKTEEAIANHKAEMSKCNDLNSRLVQLEGLTSEEVDNLRSENREFSNQIKNLESKLKSAEAVKCELDSRLNEISNNSKDCENCQNLHEELKKEAERSRQELYELSARLDLMTTANDDQEKEIKCLKAERDSSIDRYRSLKLEFEELLKKNESLSRVVQENESDMQNQQEHLDRFSRLEQELDFMKKDNTSLTGQLTQYKSDLDERNIELNSLKNQNQEQLDQIAKLKTDIKNTQYILNELRKDKESLAIQNEDILKARKDLDEQLVVGILSAMKNLESPNTSPGSDKSYNSSNQPTSEISDDKTLPNPLALIEKMSSLATDRSYAYLTTSQRLQAVLLDNSMISEELARLKDELNNLNRENSLANQTSLEEVEKLRAENQALIHDQQAYEERIAHIEEEMENMSKRLAEKDNGYVVPDPTQFEYLKNIGREPLMLAKVISAIFRFEKNQIDQICRVQEAIHSVSKQNS